MSIFILTQKNKQTLDTPVFHAGPEGQQEAIAIFTRRELAEQYVADAGWKDEYEVGELQPIQMLRWFSLAHEDGCNWVAVNPTHAGPLEGPHQSLIDLREPLTAFAETLHEQLIPAGDAEQ